MRFQLAKFPEIYGFFLGGSLGIVNTLISIWLRDQTVEKDMLVRPGTEFSMVVIFAIGGAFAGLFFGLGLRLITLVSQRDFPLRTVTWLTIGICIPLYVVSKILAIQWHHAAISAGTTLVSPAVVLLVLIVLEIVRGKRH